MPPIFADKRKTRQAKLINTIIKLIFLTSLIPAITAIVSSPYPLFSMVPTVSALILFTIILALLRRGYGQLAGNLLVFVSWLIIMLTTMFYGGINSLAFPFFIIPVLMACLLLSWQAAIGFTGLSIAAGLILFNMEYAGLLPESLASHSLINIWAIRASLLVMTTVLVYVATRHFNNESLQREISERKQAEQELQQQRNFAMTVMEALGQGISVSDYEKGLIYVNPAYARMLGYEIEDLMGKHLQDFTLPADEILLNQARVARLTGKTTSYELRMQRKDGEIVPVLVTGVPRRQEGEVIGTTVITTDLTERKRIEEDLHRRGAILETIAFAAEQFLMMDSWEDSIQEVLARLGQAANVSRVYLVENHTNSDGVLLASQRYEWTAPNIIPQLDNPELHNFDWQARGYERWQTLLSQGHLIKSHISALPAQEAKVLAAHDIQSIVVVPVFVEQHWWGFIEFDDCLTERDWPSIEIDALKIVATTLGAAVRRHQIERERLARERYLALLNDITLTALETSDLKTMLQLLADRLGDLIGADGCYITMWDETAQLPIPAAAYGELREIYPTLQAQPGEATMTASVMQAGQALVAEDVFNTSYISPRIADQFPTRSMLGLPLISGGQKLGAVLIGFNQPHRFTQDEIKRCEQAVRLVALAIAKARLVEALQKSEAQATRARYQLEDAIESLTEAFALFDAEDRLVLCNNKYHEYYHHNANLLVPGVSFEEQIRVSVQRGDVPAAIGREEEYVQQRLAQHQNPEGIHLQQLKDGRWLRISERKTRDGGIVGVRTDITELVAKEQALQESERHYRGLFEDSPISLWEQDFSGVKNYIDHLKQQGVQDFEAYFDSHPQAVKACTSLVKIVDMNQGAVELYGAANKEQLLGSIDKLMSAEAHSIFREELIYISQRKTRFRKETINTTPTGEKIHVDLSWSVAPGYEDTFSKVYISIIDITERKLAEEALRESEERFRATFEQAAVGIAHVGLDGRWLRVNQKLCDVVGYSREELLDQSFTDFTYPDTLEANIEYINQLVAGQIENYTLEKRYIHKEGTLIWANVTVSLLRSPSDEPKYLISVIEDITQRKRLETQLRQSQKLEAIGRLAGGIAHDFNNILTIIIGNSELALLSLAEDNPLYADINQIGQVAERAAALTRQLLAFSRQQVLQPAPLNLNTVVINIETLLHRLIGEHIELVTLLEPELGQVQADPSQIEQVILNLAVNARDVMPRGGKLTIETTNIKLDRNDLGYEANSEPGLYVMLAIHDTGPGIPPEIQAHIFEPFFTTKEVGQGTGLGLATVHGIIEQSGGFIKVDSALEQGTVFKIFLPAIPQASQISLTEPAALPPSGGVETILLVEDEEQVRNLTRHILETNGYNILEATNGPAALQLVQQHQPHLHMLITDVLMPGGLSGPQLAHEITILYPHIKVLYMSGYTDNTLAEQGLKAPDFSFIAKPFTPQQLMQKIRQVLDI